MRHLVFGAAALAAVLSAGGSVLAQEHEHHHDHAAVPDMDEDGKRLASYQVKHDMDAETIEALKAKIALYRGMTDREINMNMSAMGPNYMWYISDLSLEGDIGVLILSAVLPLLIWRWCRSLWLGIDQLFEPRSPGEGDGLP